ncbi:hypothetical protein MRB53_017912 [Persea americana]|uniref:Uncharacterized protein n=2 Tax=Persea americana TaxID=3435 RepID=A0ACC2M6Z2_PERAE|nr:hypothetical protein MRB53_017906 [Persea americana]KAJ8641218.1 hypothetical protein MRB53_017912 [Persea americana]
MAFTGKLETEEEIKSSPQKFWGAIKDNTDLLGKILPEVFKSIEVIEGDGKSVGSIRHIKYAEGVPISYSTERIETVDEANMMASYSLIDGDIMVGFYNKMKATAQVIPKGNGSILKWILEFEKANEEVPDPSAIMEFGIKTFHDIDAYLLNA